MKTKAVLAFFLISLLLVPETESWLFRRIRLRRIGRAIARVWKPVCSWACPRACRFVFSVGRFVCGFGCTFLCGRKKREAIEGHVTPLSTNFEYYDIDENDLVSPLEFASTLGQLVGDGDLMKAFNLTDTDEDGMLTEQELFQSPCLVFDDPPATSDGQQ